MKLGPPAVGYRIAAGRITIFHAPDLVCIHEREDALWECDLYVGDGATLDGSFVPKRRRPLSWTALGLEGC